MEARYFPRITINPWNSIFRVISFGRKLLLLLLFLFWLLPNENFVLTTLKVSLKFRHFFQTSVVDFTNIFARLFRENKMRSIFGEWCSANGKLIWQISPYILGKFHRQRMLVKLNGEFFAERCWHTKVGEIDPKCILQVREI